MVIRCQRHADGMIALANRGMSIQHGPNSQGFVTSTGRYVTRAEGRKLQDAAGIESVESRGYMLDTLTSEDLY
jgi:hypothetical protein